MINLCALYSVSHQGRILPFSLFTVFPGSAHLTKSLPGQWNFYYNNNLAAYMHNPESGLQKSSETLAQNLDS